jgi:hypothetical protein
MFIVDLPWMLPTMFRVISTSGFRGEDFSKSANQKKELLVAAMFVSESGRNLYSESFSFLRSVVWEIVCLFFFLLVIYGF